MGYDICLWDTGKYLAKVPRHNEGSVQQYSADGGGGTVSAEISVTFNYNSIYHLVLGKGLGEILTGKYAKDTIPALTKVVEKCGTNTYKDYWAATPGNAGSIAALLLDWAKLYPDGVWEVIA